MCVYNGKAIDYSRGTDIYDPLTGVVYSEIQALNQESNVKKRLVNKPKKIGCWVFTAEECDELLRTRRKGRMI